MRYLRIKTAVLGVTTVLATLSMQSCDQMNRTQKGAAIGAGAGGVVGALIGKKAGNTAIGAIIGGAIGGAGGALIGRNMDKQAADIQNTVPNAEVIREGEGIIVKFDNGILFDFDKSDLKSTARENIKQLAANLDKYPNTDIKIIGHTDNVGAAIYNMGLSERRAAAVKAFAVQQGIPGRRLTVVGKGLTEPIADNTTEAGRAQNRRVEIVIVANDQMKREARTQG